jgi:acyl-coenzyme A thioesterase PaaI-like protein
VGRTTHVWDVPVYCGDDERPVPVFRCTQLVLDPKWAD